MIIKSFEINKKKFDKENFFLIYGENEGHKNERDNILTNKSFAEEFNYDVQSDKFNMAQYEDNITNNLNSKISNDIIFLLGTLK